MPGARLRLAVPGETRQAEPCPYYYFCAYEGPGFTGDGFVKAADCNVTRSIPFTTDSGSWKNNQTRGTRAKINYLDGTHWYVPGAYSEQSSGMGWYRVRSVDPC